MSPETRAFLASVRGAEDPTPGDESRVLAALGATLALPRSLETSAGAAPAVKLAASSASGWKLAGAVVGLAAGAWVAGSALAPRAGEPPASRPPRAARAPVTEPAVPSVVSSFPVAPAAPPGDAPKRERARPSAPALPSVRDEIALLADVQAALGRGDGAAALRRLDGHVTSDRQFLAERRAARILALCALGRVDEARRAAAAFAREHAGSVQRSSLERSCAGDALEPER